MIHSRESNKLLWLSLVLTTVVASSLHAEMIYSSSDRSVSGYGTQLNEVLNVSESLATYADDLLNSGYVRNDEGEIVGSASATSSQTSTLTANQARGLGRGSGFGSGPAEGIANSSMSVEFTIDETTRFTLAGQLRLAPHGGPAGLNGSSAYVRLTGPDGVVLEVMMDEDNPPDNLGIVDFTAENQLSGVFSAGDYILEAFAEGRGSDGLTRCADFDFTLSSFEVAAVPEPAAFSLFAVAGLFCLRYRRRRGS